MIVYLAMAVNNPPWAVKAIDKFREVSFGRVGKMSEVGTVWKALGISILQYLGSALKCVGCGCKKKKQSRIAP